jgi:hypothetical protein
VLPPSRADDEDAHGGTAAVRAAHTAPMKSSIGMAGRDW